MDSRINWDNDILCCHFFCINPNIIKFTAFEWKEPSLQNFMKKRKKTTFLQHPSLCKSKNICKCSNAEINYWNEGPTNFNNDDNFFKMLKINVSSVNYLVIFSWLTHEARTRTRSTRTFHCFIKKTIHCMLLSPENLIFLLDTTE